MRHRRAERGPPMKSCEEVGPPLRGGPSRMAEDRGFELSFCGVQMAAFPA